MLKFEPESVEELTLQSVVFKPTVQLLLSVQFISDDRMIDGRKVDADLVHPTGDDLYFQ